MGTLHIYRRQTMHTLTLTLSLSLTLLPQYEARDAVKECLVCSSTYADIDPNPLFNKECADGSKKGQTCQNKNAVGCWVQQTTMKVKDKKDTVKIERGCCVDDISKAGQNADLCVQRTQRELMDPQSTPKAATLKTATPWMRAPWLSFPPSPCSSLGSSWPHTI